MSAAGGISQGLVSAYIVDSSKSRFVVRVTATGLLSAFGHNPNIAIRRFTGEVSFRPEAPEKSSLHLSIDAASLSISGDVNEKDCAEMESVMKSDVLEVESYPEIAFEGTPTESNTLSEGYYRMKLGGRLTLHGVTRPIEIPCNITASGDRLRAGGDFTIRQSDFHIQLVSAVGGTLKVKDEVRFTFDIVADRKREAA